VVAADRDPSAVGFPLADRRAVISAEDEGDIARLADAERVDGIVAPGIDWPVAVAARVAERLGLPHPISPETAAVATSKARQRVRLEEAGVPQPRWLVGREPEDALPTPCVVKPPDRQGQRGLSLVLDMDELPDAIERAAAESRTGSWLVEELVDGPELTVNAFSVDGRFHALTVTDRLVAEPPAFGVALAHAWPSVHDTEPVVAAAAAAVRALGIENGPSYTQVRLTAGGPRVIEVAARLGGGHDAELAELVTGIPLTELAIYAALGRPLAPAEVVPAFDPRAGGAALRFLTAPPGTLESVELPQGLSGVAFTRIYREPGHVFRPVRRASDRAGALVAVGATRDEALARAETAVERIRFFTAAPPEEDVALPDVRSASD